MITLSNFKGINNTADINALPQGYLKECVDFDINASGILTQREGYTIKDAGAFLGGSLQSSLVISEEIDAT